MNEYIFFDGKSITKKKIAFWVSQESNLLDPHGDSRTHLVVNTIFFPIKKYSPANCTCQFIV